MCEGKSCQNCQWNFGAIRHHCNERGGDATFEPSGESPKVKMGFEPYVLKDGPIYMLDNNGVKWKGKFFKDGVHQVKITSLEHERDTMKEMGCHFAERGEKVGGHEWQNKGIDCRVPGVRDRKSYSILGRKGANSCQTR